jgi:hypothetical protein
MVAHEDSTSAAPDSLDSSFAAAACSQIPELGPGVPKSAVEGVLPVIQTAKIWLLRAGTPDALALGMEHSDFASAVSFSLPARNSLIAGSPHRRAWLSALAFGIVGCIMAVWGAPPTQTTSTASAPTASAPATAAPSSDSAAFASGCERGDASACNDLGVTALHSAPSDVSLAVSSFERACQSGSADGCSNLGALYEAGVGVRANLSSAARLYEQACTSGAALGCSNLGALYAHGKGVARDANEARRLFTLACDTGSAAGCNNLMQVAGR